MLPLLSLLLMRPASGVQRAHSLAAAASNSASKWCAIEGPLVGDIVPSCMLSSEASNAGQQALGWDRLMPSPHEDQADIPCLARSSPAPAPGSSSVTRQPTAFGKQMKARRARGRAWGEHWGRNETINCCDALPLLSVMKLHSG